MKKHFNKLTPAELERLAMLAEECAEVIKTVMKIQRHGYESIDPTGHVKGTNREQLMRESGDVLAQLWYMAENHDIRYDDDVNFDGFTDHADERFCKLEAGECYQHHATD